MFGKWMADTYVPANPLIAFIQFNKLMRLWWNWQRAAMQHSNSASLVAVAFS